MKNMGLRQKSTPDRSAESMSRYCPMPSSIYFSLWRCSMENGLDVFDRNGMGFCLWRNPGNHLHGLYHSGWRWSVRNGMGSNGGPFGNAEEFPYSLYCSGLDCFARIWVGANADFSFWDWMVSGSGFWFWLTTGNRPFHPYGPSRVRAGTKSNYHHSFERDFNRRGFRHREISIAWKK